MENQTIPFKILSLKEIGEIFFAKDEINSLAIITVDCECGEPYCPWAENGMEDDEIATLVNLYNQEFGTNVEFANEMTEIIPEYIRQWTFIYSYINYISTLPMNVVITKHSYYPQSKTWKSVLNIDGRIKTLVIVFYEDTKSYEALVQFGLPNNFKSILKGNDLKQLLLQLKEILSDVNQ